MEKIDREDLSPNETSCDDGQVAGAWPIGVQRFGLSIILLLDNNEKYKHSNRLVQM